VLPLIAVLAVAFLGHDALKESALILALGAGCAVAFACHWQAVRLQLSPLAVQGSLGALIAIANTSAVVGFGGVAKLTAGFQSAVAAVTAIPGDPLVGAAIAVTLIAGLAGSSSGGQSIALPLLAPQYLAQGVDPDELHRVVAISSGGLDSLPHNGAIVTMVRVICRETYAGAYPAVGALTVVVPLLSAVLAVLLFAI
jgi:H+/gluconate symporter-like permease